MKVDLHVHTNCSDGSWSPEAVVEGAAKGGLDVIAIADHDTTAAFGRVAPLGRSLNLQVIPALEMSSTHETRDIHVLGYFVDPAAPALRRHEPSALHRREERMREMLERLATIGLDLDFDDVEAAAGKSRVSIGRPHLARALVTAGYVSSVQEAFDTLIGDRGPAFVPTHLLSPADAIGIIREAGGIAIWAHPPSDLVEPLLGGMVEAGLRGLEVHRPRMHRDLVARYERICRGAGLLVSGGSDWHGPEGGAALGDFFVTSEEVAALLDEGGI